MRILFMAAALLFAAACAAPASGPRVVNDPCQDPQYLALKAQPVDSLSQREYQLLRDAAAACARVTELAAAGGDAPARPGHLDTDAWTEPARNESGAEIFVRNKSTVPIIVTEVELVNCSNLADACGTTYPRIRLAPGDVRRVRRVRYGANGINSRFQFRYSVAPAEPERN